MTKKSDPKECCGKPRDPKTCTPEQIKACHGKEGKHPCSDKKKEKET